jgi:hypothetical protein
MGAHASESGHTARTGDNDLEETEQTDISHPHDRVVKTFLSELDLASSLFKNYLADQWVDWVDFDSLKGESTETVDRDPSELREELKLSKSVRNRSNEIAHKINSGFFKLRYPKIPNFTALANGFFIAFANIIIFIRN